MKENTHPKYQKVLFKDSSTGKVYICGTTLQPKDKEMYKGVEYPVCHISISSSSHPFFIGGKEYVDTEGRVGRFKNRYLAAQQKMATAPKEAPVEETLAPVAKKKAAAEKKPAAKKKAKTAE